MLIKQDVAPARLVIQEAATTHETLGHENLGSLSYTHGFLPLQEPIRNFPASHRAWDEIASDIPCLFRTYSVRDAIDGLPLLNAAPEDLPDLYLLRGASLFGILAHLYFYCEPQPPANGIPPQIQRTL